MKKNSKLISVALAMALIVCTTVNIFAQEDTTAETNLHLTFTANEQIELVNLDDSTILAYVEGIPIYVSDVNKESGDINSEKVSLIEEKFESDIDMANSEARATFADNCMTTVATSRQNSVIVVDATMSSVGFSQKEVHTYLPRPAIQVYANALEKSSRTPLVQFLTTFVPILGDAVSVATYINTARKLADVDRLRDQYTNKNAAFHGVYKSSYGYTTAVAKWDKKTIKGKNYSTTGAAQSKYVVNKISYGTKY